ncbi:hypothetical protein DWB85_17545 [Seongchinamella sediminis]|uniref:Uncharacterized protein n=1 Tax=Seongchinamella sediminis TaxID=2283635 RepID=A0A3L7DUZ8_9GAMM|nr:hypothetical protein [Seongchinamella sediminis]RLQ20420.1 hypothetical protein DWB85_17545 [Seongchinamella sediminis]
MDAYALAIIASASFFLAGLLLGVWKYRGMATSADGVAHPYIDIAHRAALMYAFASVMIAVFVQISQLSARVELLAVSLLVAYFAMAIMTYIVHGLRKDTDNQVRDMSAFAVVFMWSLIAAEIGGFLIIFYGLIQALL